MLSRRDHFRISLIVAFLRSTAITFSWNENQLKSIPDRFRKIRIEHEFLFYRDTWLDMITFDESTDYDEYYNGDGNGIDDRVEMSDSDDNTERSEDYCVHVQ